MLRLLTSIHIENVGQHSHHFHLPSKALPCCYSMVDRKQYAHNVADCILRLYYTCGLANSQLVMRYFERLAIAAVAASNKSYLLTHKFGAYNNRES
jgi:hypothetical protein